MVAHRVFDLHVLQLLLKVFNLYILNVEIFVHIFWKFFFTEVFNDKDHFFWLPIPIEFGKAELPGNTDTEAEDNEMVCILDENFWLIFPGCAIKMFAAELPVQPTVTEIRIISVFYSDYCFSFRL